VTWAFAVRAAETGNGRKALLESFRYPAFLSSTGREAMDFHYLSPAQKIVYVPVHLFLAAKVPQDPRFNAIQRRAHICIVPPAKAHAA
jgi:hypothetical protein